LDECRAGDQDVIQNRDGSGGVAMLALSSDVESAFALAAALDVESSVVEKGEFVVVQRSDEFRLLAVALTDLVEGRENFRLAAPEP